MSRKRLVTNEMLQLSAEWLDPQSPAHQAILNSTDLAPNLPRIQSAHQDLAAAAKPTALNPRLFEIIKEQTDLDGRHDDIIRGTHGLLTATATLLDDENGAPYLALCDLLIPDGLASVQKSYLAEAGQATQLESRLTPEVRAQLSKILVGPKNKPRPLTQFIDEWIIVAKQLGTLENEKARLAPTTDSTGTNLVAARNKWLRTINLFAAIAEAAEINADVDRVIFYPLRAAEIKSARRGRPQASTSDSNHDDTSSDTQSE